MKKTLLLGSKNRRDGIVEGWKDAKKSKLPPKESNLPTFHSSIWFCNQVIGGALLLIPVCFFAGKLNCQPVTFNYTGAVQTYTVGTCVYSMTVDMRAGEGAASPGSSIAGKGGRMQATIAVTPGQVLNIYVGGVATAASGGWNGGGIGGGNAGGGGGASDIRQGGTALSNRTIVAGGGGGGGFQISNLNPGGNGGGLIGSNGLGASSSGGQGGTQSMGGAGGIGAVNGDPGLSGTGGNGGGTYGGAGGGGYYGGGGGGSPAAYGGGGGGGSSYTVGTATGVVHTQGFQSGNGQIIITPVVTPIPPAPGTISGPSTVCSGDTATYSISAVSVATSYTWTVPTGSTITSGQGTATISVTFGTTSGNISVSASNACGTGPASNNAIMVNTIPNAQGVPELMYFKFNGSGSSVPNDASAPVGTNPAPIVGTSLLQGAGGQFGNGLIGTGASSTTDYINTGWATSISGSWTISLYLNNVPSSTTLFYFLGDVSAGSFRSFTNGVAGANNLMLRGTGMTDIIITNGASTTGPSISHFVYDAVAGQIKGYLNGVLVTTVAQGSPVSFSGAGPFKIGGYSSNSGLNGVMDEFRFYNRALSAAEISNTWNQTLGGPVSITGPTTVCANSTANYSINSVSGATSYNWAVPGGATITNGTGTASVSVTFGNSSGYVSVSAANNCGSSPPDSVAVIVDSCAVGISSVNENINIIISPNPTVGKFQVSSSSARSPSDKFQVEIIEIYNVMGEKICEVSSISLPFPKGQIAGGLGWAFDISSHPPGIYFVKIVSEKENFISKIIKQ